MTSYDIRDYMHYFDSMSYVIEDGLSIWYYLPCPDIEGRIIEQLSHEIPSNYHIQQEYQNES